MKSNIRRAWLVLALVLGVGLYLAAYHWAGWPGVIGVFVVAGVLSFIRERAERRAEKGGKR
jgi:uncharacterized protein (DUF58 family)